jgi:hypothetical protein
MRLREFCDLYAREAQSQQPLRATSQLEKPFNIRALN